jgi:hypothetical protein
MAHRACIQLPFLEQVHLVSANVFWPKLIRWAIEIFGKGCHDLQVAIYGSLRVIPTLEFLQHRFS